MAQRPGFDFNRLGTASKILIVGSALYFIDSFLPWNRACGGVEPFRFCVSANLWYGVGYICVLLALGLLVWEVLQAAGVTAKMAMPAWQISAALAGLLLIFTIIKVLIDSEALSFGAWIGIILALVIAYGGYMRWQEGKMMAPPATGGTMPPPPPGGPVT